MRTFRERAVIDAKQFIDAKAFEIIMTLILVLSLGT